MDKRNENYLFPAPDFKSLKIYEDPSYTTKYESIRLDNHDLIMILNVKITGPPLTAVRSRRWAHYLMNFKGPRKTQRNISSHGRSRDSKLPHCL